MAPRTVAWAATATVLALGLGACGKDPSPDIDEASATYPVEVVRATFPEKQRVSLTSDLELTLRNTGDEAVPQLAVTVWTGDAAPDESKPQGSFATLPATAAAGTPSTSVWVLATGFPMVLAEDEKAADIDDTLTGGAEVAQTDTYTFGRLEPGATKTIVWRVTAVRAGRYAVNYSVAGGVGGPAKVVDDQGGVLTGTVKTRIDDAPPGCVVSSDAPLGSEPCAD